MLWRTNAEKVLLDGNLFRFVAAQRSSQDGRSGDFVYLQAPDWVHVIAVVQDAQGRDCFVLVRQYRHGSQQVSLEFPGGVVDPGEEPSVAALRELAEETGYQAGKVQQIGQSSPNPAILNNVMYTFLASDIDEQAGKQNLDATEIVDVHLVPCQDVLEGRCPEFSQHALMLSALYWYGLVMQERNVGGGK